MLTISVPPASPILAALRQGLQQHGYVDGRNVVIEHRDAQGKPDALPAMAAELVGLKVDIIVTESVQAARAAKQATQAIPIIMGIIGDPVGAGLVSNLARPGANVTGLTLLGPELSTKRLQLLKEVVPEAQLVAVIWSSPNPSGPVYLRELQAAARTLGIKLHPIDVPGPIDLDGAFRAALDARADAFMTMPDGMLLASRVRIIQFAQRSRLPGLYPDREFAEDGGLMTYGPDLAANFRRSATYVDKILKGAKPGELPVEQPSKFELVINLKTARTLGLAVPQLIQQTADIVIE